MHAIITRDNFDFNFKYELDSIKKDEFCIPFMMVNDEIIGINDINLTYCSIGFKDIRNCKEENDYKFIIINSIKDIDNWEFKTENLDNNSEDFIHYKDIYLKKPYTNLVKLDIQTKLYDNISYLISIIIIYYTDKKNRTFHETYIINDQYIKDICIDLNFNVKVPKTILQKYPLN